jgi:hypothetical protein
MAENSVREALDEMDTDVILFDGLDGALVGWVEPINSPVLAVYDYDKIVDLIAQQSDSSWEDAVDYVGYNILGAYVGPGTPLVLIRP